MPIDYTDDKTGQDAFPPGFTMTCSICGQEYSGMHICPGWEKPLKQTLIYNMPLPVIRQAWVCPLCGRANAPHVDRCDCIEPPDTEAGKRILEIVYELRDLITKHFGDPAG